MASSSRLLRRSRRSSSNSLLALALCLATVGPLAAAHGAADRVVRGPDGDPLPFAAEAEALDFLAEANVVERRRLGKGSTNPWILVLERDGLQARAIFRTVSVQEDGIRLRSGPQYAAFYDSALAEVAAYELARLLGIDMIPPVVERAIGSDKGTVQLWIEDSMTETDRSKQGLRPPSPIDWHRQRTIMRVFDALVYNSDRNTGNSLIDADWNLWMIDHTRTFQRPRGKPDYSGIGQIPTELWEALRALDHDEVRGRLRGYLEGLQIRSLLDRHEDLVEHFESLIQERGFGAVVLP